MSWEIRAARDSDGSGLIALIGACFAEYAGCVLDVEGEIPELRAIASAFTAQGGAFWVVEREGLIVGSIGWRPGAGGAVELCKLYVAPSARRGGLGSELCERVERTARERGAGLVELWSDTRFRAAHQLYAARGYRRGEQTRLLHDRSGTEEYYFSRGV